MTKQGKKKPGLFSQKDIWTFAKGIWIRDLSYADDINIGNDEYRSTHYIFKDDTSSEV